MSLPLALFLVLPIAPAAHPPIQPVPIWAAEELGEDQCAPGSHLHQFGLVHDWPGPPMVGSGKCHRDDDDSVVPDVEQNPKER
jgi:hypothetical protein